MTNKMRKKLRGQEGFTLIEIIAVLIILGILAAVAVPKFLDVQDESKRKSAALLVAAGQSQMAMEYSRALLAENGNTAAAWTNTNNANCANVNLSGYPSGTNLTCTKSGNTITIVGTYEGNTSLTYTGNFYNPAQ